MHTLFVVATPIGNLGDITYRAAEVLKRVPVVAAEDTRVTARLLAHIGATPRLVSYHEDSPESRVRDIVAMLAGHDVALVTDAGTPGLSDPGAGLVAAAAAAGSKVEAVPGVSALTALLSVSGVSADRFIFLGFLPRAAVKRRALLVEYAQHGCPIVVYEAPHRLRDCLADIADALGDSEVVVGREMTKLHEEVYRGAASDALAHFAEPRGEFVIAIKAPARAAAAETTDEEVAAALAAGRAMGLSGRSLVDRVTGESGAARGRVYRLELETRERAAGPE
jgi:16S rRNA (cytidine1402-2'-O)-methyltransferase